MFGRSKSKKNPISSTNERKQGDEQQTNAPQSNVQQKPAPPIVQEKPAPPNEQQTVIVESPPTTLPSPITVSPPNTNAVDFSNKHPLNSKWTLWYYYPEKNTTWEKCQHQIHTVDTVEDFWSLADHIVPPSELMCGVDYSFFKNGIRPMWEDTQNREGGRLTVISAPKLKSALIDEIWLDVLLFLIGENHPNADSVCGVVLNTRQYGFKIAVWTSIHDGMKVKGIGQSIKSSLSTYVQSIPFEVHADTQKKAHIFNKSSSRGPTN